MRYKIIAKQYKPPGNLIVRLEDGRVLRGPPEQMGQHLSTGDTGRMVQGHKRIHFKPDAIDLDYTQV